MKSLSRRRAAARLGIAPSTLATLEAKGIAPTHTRIGSVSRYAPEALDEYLASRTVKASQ